MRELLPGIEEHNYSKTPLTAEQVRAIVTAAGGVAPVLNSTHTIAKERGWKANPPATEEFVALAVTEPNLLRRPIVLKDGKIVVGKNEAGWLALR